MLQKKSLQYVIPIYNEEECVEMMVKRLSNVAKTIEDEYHTEYIFINDGSKDKTLEILTQLSHSISGMHIIDLSRNFGHQIALSAGLDYADADFIAIIDGDLQDPPELVPKMLGVAAQGFDIVYGQRSERKGETAFKKITAHLFYRLIVRMCQVNIPPDTGDFRLINKKVLYSFKKFKERHRFIRGMVPWLGFKSAPFHYIRDERFAGETKYPLKKMIRFALDAILSFSNLPLRTATYSGFVMVLAGVCLGFYMLYLKLILNSPAPGLTALLLVILILGGFQILMLGLIGEYVGRIFEEVKNRPLYVINEIIKSEKRI